jgi:CheY-like chemotaxis protein
VEVETPGSARLIRILLVEDSRTDAALAESLLEHSPAARFAITVVGTMADALAWLARRSPDVILLDLTLPDSEGLQTYRAIRNRSPNVPVVVMTGLQESGLGQAAVQHGAQDFLAKGRAATASPKRCCSPSTAPSTGQACSGGPGGDGRAAPLRRPGDPARRALSDGRTIHK